MKKREKTRHIDLLTKAITIGIRKKVGHYYLNNYQGSKLLSIKQKQYII